jgi:ABC-type transport system involved in multi-copper enzyme maturation permease subunit
LNGRKTQNLVKAKGFREPSELAIFSNGVDEMLPNYMSTDYYDGLILSAETYLDNPLSVLYGKIDFSFMVNIVMSLLAIVFTFNAVTGEKEEGTFKLIMSNSLDRWKILFSKIIGAFISISIPLIISILISLIIISLSGTFEMFNTDFLVKIGIILLISFIYVLVFINLGIFISTMTHKSLNSKLMLLFIWVLFVLAIPKLSNMLTDVIHPVKSRQVLNLEKRIAKDNLNRERGERLKDIWDDQENYDELRKPIAAEFAQREKQLMTNMEQEYLNRKNNQTQLAKSLSRISPSSSFMLAISELSNTGLSELDNFLRYTEQFSSAMEDEVYSVGYTDISEKGYKFSMGVIDLTNMPRFLYQKLDIQSILKHVWFDITLLILFNILFFTGSYVRFLRYDVR